MNVLELKDKEIDLNPKQLQLLTLSIGGKNNFDVANTGFILGSVFLKLEDSLYWREFKFTSDDSKLECDLSKRDLEFIRNDLFRQYEAMFREGKL